MSDLTARSLSGEAFVLREKAVQEFAGKLRGPLLLPGDAGYDAARTLHNAMLGRSFAPLSAVRRTLTLGHSHFQRKGMGCAGEPEYYRSNKEEPDMSAIDDVLEANRRYAEEFHQPGIPRPPTRKLVVVSCMDTRVGVSELLGLSLGEAHIIRNAGGIVTEDVLRSLIISHYIGGTQEIMIINNTKCGMLTFRDDELLMRIQEATGKMAAVPACFHAFTDLEENVRQQVRKVQSHPWIPENVSVRGFIYDVDTGLLREVPVSSPAA